MKTKNFPSKVNNRRKKALMKLKYDLNKYNEKISQNETQIKTLLASKNKEATSQAEELMIRNRAIVVETKPLIKEIGILEGKTIPDEAARARRTKKNRDGQRRHV